MKRYIILVLVLLAGWMIWGNDAASVEAAGKSVKINKKNFPDEDFRAYVKKKCDKDKNGRLSWKERSRVTRLYHDDADAKYVFQGTMSQKMQGRSLQGIGYFPNLKEIHFTNVNLGKIDLSKNKKLEIIYLFDTHTPGLNLRKNVKLRDIYFQRGITPYKGWKNHVMKTVDFTNNVELRKIDIEVGPKVREIDLTPLTKLEFFGANGGNISKLDLSKNVNLKSFHCREEKLKKLDFSNCKKLEYVECAGNRLTELLLPAGVTLRLLSCARNNLSVIDLTGVKFEGVNADAKTLIKDKKTKVIYGE